MNSTEKHQAASENYDYELPGTPVYSSRESLGESFFTHPSTISPDIKPFDPDRDLPSLSFRRWYIACAIVLTLGLIFEFGFLGKDGRQGPLCHYLPKNKACFILAGPAPVVHKK